MLEIWVSGTKDKQATCRIYGMTCHFCQQKLLKLMANVRLWVSFMSVEQPTEVKYDFLNSGWSSFRHDSSMVSSSKVSNIASAIAFVCACADDEEAETSTVSDFLTLTATAFLKEMIAYVELNLQYPWKALTWRLLPLSLLRTFLSRYQTRYRQPQVVYYFEKLFVKWRRPLPRAFLRLVRCPR